MIGFETLLMVGLVAVALYLACCKLPAAAAPRTTIAWLPTPSELCADEPTLVSSFTPRG